eukprot:tig00000769_g4025.t1
MRALPPKPSLDIGCALRPRSAAGTLGAAVGTITGAVAGLAIGAKGGSEMYREHEVDSAARQRVPVMAGPPTYAVLRDQGGPAPRYMEYYGPTTVTTGPAGYKTTTTSTSYSTAAPGYTQPQLPAPASYPPTTASYPPASGPYPPQMAPSPYPPQQTGGWASSAQPQGGYGQTTAAKGASGGPGAWEADAEVQHALQAHDLRCEGLDTRRPYDEFAYRSSPAD